MGEKSLWKTFPPTQKTPTLPCISYEVVGGGHKDDHFYNVFLSASPVEKNSSITFPSAHL